MMALRLGLWGVAGLVSIETLRLASFTYGNKTSNTCAFKLSWLRSIGVSLSRPSLTF